jgi:dTDP-4-dehydrorhamnose 3,5-epimerase
MKPQIENLPISGVKLVRVNRISDSRGYFVETYARPDFVASGLDYEFIQDNESRSEMPGTVRGLHFQVPPFAQTKLVRVLRGRVLDVVVDLRRSSPTYGKHAAVELNETTGEQLLVPVGFAHGYCALEPQTVIFYKVDQVYSAAHERGIHWGDPGLAIAWPVAGEGAIVSEKDQRLPNFDYTSVYFE